ncbi:MAG: DUF2231 domain-containing protein [Patescibacteria group bacterium]
MVIHPLFVHFPVALLSLYAFLELFRFRKLVESNSWFNTKLILLITGTLGALATLKTGELDAESKGEAFLESAVFKLHESAAELTTAIFIFITALYFIRWLIREDLHEKIFAFLAIPSESAIRKIFAFFSGILRLVVETPLILLFALFGLSALLLTGALGGILVYGPDADPITRVLFDFLSLTSL